MQWCSRIPMSLTVGTLGFKRATVRIFTRIYEGSEQSPQNTIFQFGEPCQVGRNARVDLSTWDMGSTARPNNSGVTHIFCCWTHSSRASWLILVGKRGKRHDAAVHSEPGAPAPRCRRQRCCRSWTAGLVLAEPASPAAQTAVASRQTGVIPDHQGAILQQMLWFVRAAF